MVSCRQEKQQGVAYERSLGQKMQTEALAVTFTGRGMVDKPLPALNLSFLTCPVSLGGWINSHTRACIRIPQRAVHAEFQVPPHAFPSHGVWGRARESAFPASSQVTLMLLVWDHTLRTTGLETTVP